MEVKYPFIARSISDPNGEKGGLGFLTQELAQAHCDVMNAQRAGYPGNGWNTDFWKDQPGEWIVVPR